MPTTIICTVTNDLTYDQRMIRICSSLAKAGYDVCLVGRQLRNSKPLQERPYRQKRLRCWFNKGKLFYMEFNLRLFFWLLFSKWQVVCSIDLDSILAGFYASRWRRRHCVYDAHEYFTEVPEVVNRPRTKRVWEWVARRTIPRIKYAYTVCQSLAEIFERNYGTTFEVIRNVPFADTAATLPATANTRFTLLYQGALNDGRGLEELIDAMPRLPDVELWLAGEGDLSQALRHKAQQSTAAARIRFLGYVLPEQLRQLTLQIDAGVNLLQNKGLNYYYSLANKFFDYIQAEKPSINMDFPEYRSIVQEHKVALLVPDLAVDTLVTAIKQLAEDKALYAELQAQCRVARQVYTWEQEEKKLLRFYERVGAREG